MRTILQVRSLSSILALTLSAGTLGAFAPAAAAWTTPVPPPATGPAAAPVPDQPGVKRLGSDERYATAAKIVQDSFPRGPVPVVVIATGTAFADALAAGPAADVLGGPVLPVAAAGIPAPIRAELTRLQPGRIVILGGSGAVSTAIARELDGFTTGTVTRLEGRNRYATAARVATEVFQAAVPQVLVATGASFADALAGGAVGAKTNSPVLLVSEDGLPAETAAALRQLRPRNIAVLGGTGVVSEAVLNALRPLAVGGGVTRLYGPDRYGTAARLAQVFWPTTTPVVYLATGRNLPDALAGVPAAGHDQAPLLFVEPTCMPAATKREIDRLRPTTIVVLGGTTSVNNAAAAGTVCAPPAYAATVAGSWRMDESSGATVMDDSAGYNNDGAIGSKVKTAISYGSSRGYSFTSPPSGVADDAHLVLVPDRSSLDPGSRSMHMRVDISTTDSDANLLLKGQAGTPGGRYKVEIENGRASCQFQGNIRTRSATWPTKINDGRHHKIVCDKYSNRVRISVDGGTPVTSWGGVGSISNAKKLSIGGKYECNATAVDCDYYTGTMGGASVYFD